MKYISHIVCIDAQGFKLCDTLEEAKKQWSSMYIEVYESTDEQNEFIKNNIKDYIKDYEMFLDYMKNNCKYIGRY